VAGAALAGNSFGHAPATTPLLYQDFQDALKPTEAPAARGTFLRCVVAELRGRGDFSDCDVEQVCARRCSISQPHDVLEDNAAGGQRARFPVERWRVKTAPRVRCPAPGLGMPLVGSGVLRLAQQFRQLGDVGGDAAGLVIGEPVGDVATARLLPAVCRR
jgi:hypothetical protein